MGAQGEDKKPGSVEKQLAVYGIVIFVVACLLYYGAMKLFYKPKTTDNPNVTVSTQIQYEKVNLQGMLDELDANAMRAEEKYQDKHIEITGKIRSFDSDGKYISIVPCEASDWSINTVKCNLTDQTHKTFLLEKSVGDVVTVKGKVFSIGEVLGYSVKIAEISD
jgi:hypothetical protein